MNQIKNLYKLNQVKIKEKRTRKEGSNNTKEGGNFMKGVLSEHDLFEYIQNHNFYRWILKPVGK